MTQPKDRLLTSKEVSLLLSVTVMTVNNYRKQGYLKAKQYGPRTFRYLRSEVDKLLVDITELRTGEVAG